MTHPNVQKLRAGLGGPVQKEGLHLCNRLAARYLKEQKTIFNSAKFFFENRGERWRERLRTSEGDPIVVPFQILERA